MGTSGEEHVMYFVQTGITPQTTVREILDRYPATAVVLGEAGLDCCCGGVHPLKVAAGSHGVDLDKLVERLQAAALRGLCQASATP